MYVDHLDLGYSKKYPAYIFYQKRSYNVLDGGYSSHPLEDCSVIEIGENCDEFDNEIEKYKK